MTNYSRTTLRELKKRYLNILKKCLLLNMGLVFLSTPVVAIYNPVDVLQALEDKSIAVTLGNKIETVKISTDELTFVNEVQEVTSGGKLSIVNNSHVTFEGGKIIFLNNKSTSGGGGVYFHNGFANFESVDFIGNTTECTGGAIYAYTTLGHIIFNGKVNFLQNKSIREELGHVSGGAISNNLDGEFDGDKNFINRHGIIFKDEANFNLNKVSTIGGNADGGAIYNAGGTADIKQQVDEDGNVIIDENNNPITDIEYTYGIKFEGNTLFTSNKAESETGNIRGGAIYNTGYMLLEGENTFGGYQTYENGDYVLDSEGNKISLGNEAKAGGAILNVGGKKEGNVIAYGMTLGKSTFMGNTALSSGGAIYNSGYMNFTDEATFEGNTSLSSSGAIYNSGYMNFTDESTFEGNKATSETGYIYGGAIWNSGQNSIIKFSGESAHFKGNLATSGPAPTYGGAITNSGNISFSTSRTVFEENASVTTSNSAHGGAIYNAGIINFLGENLSFTDNSTMSKSGNVYGGAIYSSGGSVVFEDTDSNEETLAVPNITYGMTFNGNTLFTGNKAESDSGTARGGAIYNSGYMLLAGENTFDSNQVKQGGVIYNTGGKKNNDTIAYGMTLGKSTFMNNTGGAIFNTGYIDFTDEALFEGNKAKQGGAIYNNYSSTITFGGLATFEDNTSSATGGHSYGGAIHNNGSITFDALATFEGNSAKATGGNSYGGVIHNSGANAVLTVNDEALFKNNKAESETGNAEGGAIYNNGSITFDALATFEGNSATATGGNSYGGAIHNYGASAVLTFNNETQFKNNKATVPAMEKADSSLTGGYAWGGAIYNYNNAIINFNNSFTFTNNKRISKGVETPNDIDNNSTINFNHGLDENGVALIGSLDGGIANSGTINKTGAGTLILGDKMVNSGSGTFNQSAGLTIAHADYFLTGTNNITGGELRVHGANMDNLKATVGGDALLTFLSTSTSEIEMKLGKDVSVAGDVKFGADDSVGTAKYHLKDDVTAKTITIQDSILTAENKTFNSVYIMGENVTLNMQDGDAGDSVSFANLTGSANLKIDADIVNGANGLELVTDQIVTNSDATLKLNLTDVVLSEKALDNGLSESYTATVMTGGTLTYGSEKGLVATDIYSYEVSGANNQITIDAVKFNEEPGSDVMKSVAEFDGDAAFNMTIGGDSYEMKSDVTMTENTKSIIGKDKETSTLTAKKITVDGAILNVENVSVSGENQLIDVASGTLNITNAKVDNIKNAGEATLNTAEVSELENAGTLTANGSEIGELMNEQEAEVTGGKVAKVTNKGTMTANGSEIGELVNEKDVEVMGGKVTILTNKGTMTANSSEIGELLNEHEAEVTDGELETATNKEKGMLSLSAGLRAGTVTNEGELTLDGVTVADLTNSATLKANGSTLTKLVNEQEAELTASTVEDLTNTGTMTAKDLTLKGALKGAGTATLSGKLVADDIFKSENKIISDGMEVSENVKKMELADLEVKSGTTLDIGTRQVTAKDVKVGDEATLQVTLNDLDEHGTMNADKIDAGTGAGVHLVLGEKFEGGVFDVFQGTKGAGDLEVKHNNLYNVIEVEEGKYSFMTKDTEALQESLGATKEEVSVADAMTKGTSTNPAFNKMQSEMLIALQSLETETVAKAKKALSAVGAKEQPIEQSVASEHLVALQNVVQAELHGSTVGHSGGDTDPRAKVYIKGLYDRTKSSMGEGFRARSKGAVLGVQSEVTEDLTLGVGYATSQTTAKEDLRRTEVDTNTGFVSAHYQPNAWWVSGLATFSRGEYEEEKQILSSMGKATYDVDSWGAQVMTGYDIKLENAIITPEVGLRYIFLKQEGYTDTLGTTVSGTRSDYLTALVGVKGTWDMGAIRPTAGVTVGYDIISDDVSALNTLANGASYTVNGEALDRLSTTVTTGIEADLGDRTTLKLEYSGTFRKEYADHSGMLKLEVRF